MISSMLKIKSTYAICLISKELVISDYCISPTSHSFYPSEKLIHPFLIAIWGFARSCIIINLDATDSTKWYLVENSR